MCGIAGYFSKNKSVDLFPYLQRGVACLAKRGPDQQQAIKLSPQAGFGHARLSIIDTSSIAHQPMSDLSGRYTIIFNGEIFNYRELKQQFLQDVRLKSHSDTEILLNMYIKLGEACLQHLNGFFAFAIYDNQLHRIFLARDRYGIKPLHIYSDDDMLIFASEIKTILSFPVKKQLDYDSLFLYLQLNYLPDNNGILKNITRLAPGHFAIIDSHGNLLREKYYSVPYKPGSHVPQPAGGYSEATKTLRRLVEEAVERRLVSDVPLGTFLSGGIDSSIVTACAAKHVKALNTFSVGYKDEPYFDETNFATLVAKRHNTNHTVFSITNDEMFAHIFDVLDYIDEPFADSSAIAVYILSYYTRKKVTVSLSGDGGDELFAGYNKHKAELKARSNALLNPLAKALSPVLNRFPQSRHSKVGNLFRQAHRYAEGLKLTESERYWRWCILLPENEARGLFKDYTLVNATNVAQRKTAVTNLVKPGGEINDVLYADTQMLLPGDMLTKVDLMSMANSLEIRVPLLDYTVVNYAFTLPVEYKIDATGGKKILKDAFRNELPGELFNRPKRGFEVPLLKWMRTGLKSLIEDDLLNKDFIVAQGIFNPTAIELLKQRLYSNNPGDVHATVWALLVFQYWYKKYFL